VFRFTIYNFAPTPLVQLKDIKDNGNALDTLTYTAYAWKLTKHRKKPREPPLVVVRSRRTFMHPTACHTAGSVRRCVCRLQSATSYFNQSADSCCKLNRSSPSQPTYCCFRALQGLFPKINWSAAHIRPQSDSGCATSSRNILSYKTTRQEYRGKFK
jgi:hypothetical protein